MVVPFALLKRKLVLLHKLPLLYFVAIRWHVRRIAPLTRDSLERECQRPFQIQTMQGERTVSLPHSPTATGLSIINVTQV